MSVYYDELMYRSYITDAQYLAGQGKAFTKRFVEIIDDFKNQHKKDIPPEQIASDIMNRMGLKFKEKEANDHVNDGV